MNNRLKDIDTSLYFVTDSAQCAHAGRGVAATAAAAVRGGAGIVQVRDKTLDDAAFYALALEVLNAVDAVAKPAARRVPVVLNDRVAVAAKLRAAGHDVHIHVGQSDTPVSVVRQQLGSDVLIGLSASTPQEFTAAENSACVDLVGIGPAFATATKPDAGAGLGVAHLTELAASTALPAVAIGGIDLTRAALLRDTGVIGICVVSAICLAADPELAARQLLLAFKPSVLTGVPS